MLADPAIINDLETKAIPRNEAPLHLTAEEAFHFLDTVRRHGSERDYAMFLIMLSMGLRISEVIQMNVDYIGPDTEFYHVVDGKVKPARTSTGSVRKLFCLPSSPA